ncbi:hypothetical protein ACWDTP_01000 [Mycobacterium sp. NPDC003449]
MSRPTVGTSHSWHCDPSLPRCELCHFSCYYCNVVISRELYSNIPDLAKPQYKAGCEPFMNGRSMVGIPFANRASARGMPVRTSTVVESVDTHTERDLDG